MPAVDLHMEALERSASRRRTFYRWFLFLILGVFAIYYLAPMYVMIVTSFKSMEEIRKGNLMMLPKEFLLDAWKIIGLNPKSSLQDVKKKYKVLAKKWHPDTNLNFNKNKKIANEKFVKITNAYNKIMKSFSKKKLNITNS